MPNPGKVHIDAALTNFAVLRGTGSFAAAVVLPILPVTKISDLYFVGDDSHISDMEFPARARGGVAPEIDWSLSTDPYVCQEYPLRKFISFDEERNADAPIKVQKRTTAVLKNKRMLSWELRAKTMLTTAGNFGSSFAAAGTGWGDLVNGNPELDLDTARENVEVTCGYPATHVVIPPAKAKQAKRHPKIRALVENTHQDLLVNGDLPSTLFNLQVVIPGAIQNTANPALAAAISRVWNNTTVAVLHIDATEGDEVMTWGRTFRWTGYGPNGELVTTYDAPDRRGYYVEYGYHQTEELVFAGAGSLITGV